MIFQAKNVIQIPTEYVLQRWPKDANRCIEVDDINVQIGDPDVLRSVHVESQFNKFSDLAKRSAEAYEYIMKEFDRIYITASTMKVELPKATQALEVSNQENLASSACNDSSDFCIKDPNISQTKGRRRNDSDKTPVAGRYKSGLEVSINKTLVKRRTCKSCGEQGHYQSTCKKKPT